MHNSKLHFHQVEHQIHEGDSVFPQVVVNENDIASIEDWEVFLADNFDEIEAQLKSSGAVLFRGFPVDSAESFDRFSSAFGYPNFTYKEPLARLSVVFRWHMGSVL